MGKSGGPFNEQKGAPLSSFMVECKGSSLFLCPASRCNGVGSLALKFSDLEITFHGFSSPLVVVFVTSNIYFFFSLLETIGSACFHNELNSLRYLDIFLTFGKLIFNIFLK